MDFEIGGVTVQAGFPLDVTLLCLGLLAGWWGLVRRQTRETGARAATTRQTVAFTAGVALFWIVDGWPVQALAEHLFSVHMFQHMLQGFVIPPLLLLGIPRWMGEKLLARPGVRRVVKRLANPVFAGLAFNIVLLGTHSPQAIELQLTNSLFHAVDHLLLIGTGIFMYLNVHSPVPHIIRPLPPLHQMFYLFLMSLLPTIPTAFLVFGEHPLYPIYAMMSQPWGVSLLEDMQLGGLIMKLGGGFYLWTIIAVKYFRWSAAQERADRAERAAEAAIRREHLTRSPEGTLKVQQP